MSIRTTGVRYDVIAKDSASKPFEKIGKSAGRLDGGLGKIVKTAALAGAALAGGLAVGLAVSAEKAVKFQSEMKKVQTQAGASAKDVKILSAQVLELGKTTQQGPEKLSEALYHLKSVGMDNVQAMSALKVASDLAAVGQSDLEATTNALAGAWRTGIKGAETFSKTASTVNAIIGAGNMRMDQFTAAIGTGILPSAKSFGLSLQQVGAALALMTDEGIPAVDAATRLRMSFSLLGAPSKAADKQLKKIGLTGLDLAEAMRGPQGLIGAVSLLKQHLDDSGLSAARQSQILSRSFGGGRSSAGILTLLNNLDVLKKKQIQVNNSMGKYGAAVAEQRKTVKAQLDLIESNLNVFAIKTGNKLLPPLTTFVMFINREAIPAAGKFSATLGDMVPVAKIKSGIGTVSGFITDFLTGLKGPKKKPVLGIQPKIELPKNLPPDALKFGAAITTPVKVTPKFHVPKNLPPNALDFGAALKTVVPQNLPPSAIRYGITPHITGPAPKIKSQAQQLGDQVRNLISGGVGDAITKTLKTLNWKQLGSTLGEALGKGTDWLAVHISDVAKKIEKAFGKLDWVDVGKTVGGQALGFAIGFMTSMGAELFKPSFWEHHWLDVIIATLSVVGVGKLAGPIAKIFEHIPILRMFSPLLSGINKMTEPIGNALGKLVKFFGRSFWAGFAKVFPEGAAVLERESGLLVNRIGYYAIDFGRAGMRMVRGLGDGIKSAVAYPVTKLSEGISYLLKPFVKAGGWLYKAGGDAVRGLGRGIGSVGGTIGKFATDHVVTPVKGAFSRAGSWLYSRGAAAVTGLKDGAVSVGRGIGGWMKTNVADKVTGAFSRAGSWLYARGGALVSGFKSGALSVGRTIGGWTKTNVIDKTTGAFSKAGSWLKGSGGRLISGLKDGITGAMKGIGGWIKSSLVDPIVSAVKRFFGIRSPSRVFAGIGGHLVSGLVKGLATSNGLDIAKTVFGDLPSALAHIVGKGLISIEKLPGKALNALMSVSGAAKGVVDKLFGGGGHNDLVGNWATDVRTVLAMLGAPPDALSAVLTRIRIESGGNPNAINLTDSNAKAGHPSQGLMQTIPGTFNTYAGPFRSRGITDPMASIYAGVNYAMHRYGANWISVMTRPGGYAAGGLAPFGQTAWVGEKGPELMQVTSKGTRIYSNGDSMALAKGAGIKVPGYAKGTVSLDRARRDVSRAQRQVTKLEKEIAALRHAEATAHTKAQRKRDQLAIMAAEQELKAARKRLTAAGKELTAANTQAKRVLSVANAIQNGFLKTLETSTAAGIASAVKSMNSKLQTAGFGRLVPGNLRAASKLESLAGQRASVQSRISQANDYARAQSDNLGGFLAVSNFPSSSIASLIKRMQNSQTVARNFANEESSLSKRGLNKNLLGQLADAGPGSQLAALLSKASASDIAQLNKLAASQSKLTTSFGQSMANSMYDSGSQAGKGFLSGLKAQEKDLQAEMNKIAKGMVDTIKKALGIKSPSTVFRDQIGKQIIYGTAAGRAHARPESIRGSPADGRHHGRGPRPRGRRGGLLGARWRPGRPVPPAHHLRDQRSHRRLRRGRT
jgi:TP901 family phage tail tape measure protein